MPNYIDVERILEEGQNRIGRLTAGKCTEEMSTKVESKMTLHLARLKARQDEAQYIRSPEESKERCDELEREIQQEEQRIEIAGRPKSV